MSNPGAETGSSHGFRTWIVNHYADAPDRPSGTRHFDLARELVARGHAVTIFAAGFSHMSGREERLTNGRLYRVQWFDGVRFVWIRTVPYRGNTVRRQLNMLSFLAAFVVVQTRFAAPDAIVGSTVHPFAALGGWFAARLRGARFLFEVRDLWPQTLVDLGVLREGSPGERLLRAIEAFLVRHAWIVITLLPGMRDYLQEQGLPADHVVYVPNGVDLERFDADPASDNDTPDSVQGSLGTVRRMRAEGRLVLGYVGSFGRVNELGVVIRAAAIAEERAPGRVGLILVGDGPERPTLERAARGCRNVVLCPAVPKRFVPMLLRALDGAVVHATATPIYRYGISFNKLFEYMAAARPVVFACASAYDPVAAAGAGISVRPDDPELLARACLELEDAGPEARARMGDIGRAYVSNEHDMAHLGAVLANAVEGKPMRALHDGQKHPSDR